VRACLRACVRACVCEESGEDLEIGGMSKARGDTHIVDVTDEFVGCQDIIDSTTHDGSSDAESSATMESAPASPVVALIQQAETKAEGLSEAVANIRVQDDSVASSSSDVEVAIVLGGMDTNGEIFDDCLAFRLRT